MNELTPLLKKSKEIKTAKSPLRQQTIPEPGFVAILSSIHFISLLFSFVVSVLFIWLVGYLFCDSLRPFTYDEKLQKFIHTPYTVYKQRSEGYAETFKGLFGINSIPDIRKVEGDKIVIWGDSYVEGHQVNDDEKIAQVLTGKLAKEDFGHELMSFGVGMSGDSVADYFFEIPRYERVVKDIVAHYIVITNCKDILPDQPTDTKKGLFKSNPFRFYEDRWVPRSQKLKNILYDLRLSFVWRPTHSTLSALRNLKFVPEIQKVTKVPALSVKKTVSEKFLVDSWSFLLEKLDKQTKVPIAFVYAPVVPVIQKGKISGYDNNAREMALFTSIANSYGIDVLNATVPFISFSRKTGLFPRGFSNSKPGEGHFNKYGNAIVATMILDHISQSKQ